MLFKELWKMHKEVKKIEEESRRRMNDMAKEAEKTVLRANYVIIEQSAKFLREYGDELTVEEKDEMYGHIIDAYNSIQEIRNKSDISAIDKVDKWLDRINKWLDRILIGESIIILGIGVFGKIRK